MTPEELRKRQERAARETIVISESEEGFRVYSPNAPHRIWIVAGDQDAPSCSCPDFQHHAHDPEWRCKHILAVVNRLGSSDGPTEHTAVATEADTPPAQIQPLVGRPAVTQMLIKRSVSPDGRIDALSVEFTCSVAEASAEDIQTEALMILNLQDGITGRFLERDNGSEDPEGAMPATMIGIGGIDGKWGRRLFITFRANGRNLRLYGNRKQLAEAIAAAGEATSPEALEEDLQLNIPCRVVTKPSSDGRYLNIEEVLPASTARNWITQR